MIRFSAYFFHTPSLPEFAPPTHLLPPLPLAGDNAAMLAMFFPITMNDVFNLGIIVLFVVVMLKDFPRPPRRQRPPYYFP